MTFWLCRNWRDDHNLPRLLTVPVPVTPDKAAPGFVIERDSSAWVLKEAATGVERRFIRRFGIGSFFLLRDYVPGRTACGVHGSRRKTSLLPVDVGGTVGHTHGCGR